MFACISIFDFVQIDSRAQSTDSTPFEEAAMRAVVESYYAARGKKDLSDLNIHPELSGMVLSLVDEAGQRQDRFLGLQEMRILRSAEQTAKTLEDVAPEPRYSALPALRKASKQRDLQNNKNPS
jgi:hypothetical protein